MLYFTSFFGRELAAPLLRTGTFSALQNGASQTAPGILAGVRTVSDVADLAASDRERKMT